MKNHYSIDLIRLKRALDECGLSARQASLKAGLGQHFVAQLLNGSKSPHRVQSGNLFRLERILGSLQALDRQNSDGDWFLAPRCVTDFELIGDGIENIREWITFGTCAPTTLMCDEMRNWTVREGYRRLGRDPQWIEAYMRLSRRRRHADILRDQYTYTFLHRQFCRDDVFRMAASENPDWIRAFARTLKDTDEATALTFVKAPVFAEVAHVVGSATGFWNCCYMEIVDDIALIVRQHCGGVDMVTKNRDMVKRVRDVISHAIRPFPCSVSHATEQLDRIARGVY